MRRGIILLGVFILLLIAPIAFRFVNYRSFETVERAEVPTYDPVEFVDFEPTPPSTAFVDEPEVGEGAILLDMAHDNDFSMDEMGFLNGRVSARGFNVIPYTDGNLAAQLRAVNAFVVITPLSSFSFEEIQAVKDFVARGGRLLLVGDPTRYEIFLEEDLFDFIITIEDDKIPLNSLASEFDITFKGDYLYNMVNNEGNFKNILLNESNFGEAANDLTEDLTQVVFYGAHSLNVGPEGDVLFVGDADTWSSATDRSGGLTLAATSQNGRVLAVGDLHFMTNPYHTSYDNGRLVAHIADFLTDSGAREFSLSDFPYFFGETANLVYTGNPDLGPQAFTQVIDLQKAFQTVGKTINLASSGEATGDALVLGLFNQADEEVLEILASHGVTLTITPPVLTDAEMKALESEAGPAEESDVSDVDVEEGTDEETSAESEVDAEVDDPEGEEAETEDDSTEEVVHLIHTPLGNVQMSGTAVVLLDDEGDGRRTVLVLAASKDGLENTVNLLLDVIPLNADYAQAGCVVQDSLALCPTEIADEEVEAELLTGGQPESEEDEESDDEEASDEETDDESEEDEEDEGQTESDTDLDAENQGTITLDETVEGELQESESHAWTFSDGPVVIDIILEGGESLDAVLELYDPDNNFITSSDSTFTGETEEIIGAEIGDDGDYTIVIRDFYDDGGTYSLTVQESDVAPGEDDEEEDDEESSSGEIENIFIFIDDDGEPISTGFTSADAFIDLLGSDYEITTWVSSVDGPLEEDTLEGTDLLIWDSGDYREEDSFFSDDIFIILNFLDSGVPVFINGSSPALLSDAELAPLADLEIAGDDEILLDGLTSGDVIELNDVYDVVLSDTLVDETEEGSTPFFLRGPNSDAVGQVIGIATIDDFTEQRSVLLLVPFVGLPEDIQELWLTNLMTWFAEE